MSKFEKITFQQLLHYMDEEDVFQLCFEGDGWENYVEITKESKLLKPFLNCRVVCMGAEILDNGNQPTIRISLDDSEVTL